jgi:hypothetical protein
MGHRRQHTPLAIVLTLSALFASVSSASADLIIGSPGSGAGQYESPKGVAVDTSTGEPSSGHVYVADTANNRIGVFDSTGAFLFAFGWNVNALTPEEKLQVCTAATGCQKGTPGSGPGQFEQFGEGQIAVDSSSHAVYVGEDSNHRVQKFDSEGHFLRMWGKGVNSGTSGKPDLCTNATAPTDVCGKGTAGFGPGEFNEAGVYPFQVDVGPGGTVYVVDSKDEGSCPILGSGSEYKKRVQIFNSTGELIETAEITGNPCGDAVTGLAVDATGDFYLANNGLTGAVRRYKPTGDPVVSWGESGKVNPSSSLRAIAVDPAGNLFVADAQEVEEILRYDPSGAKNLVFFGNGTFESRPISLAFHHTASGDLFAAEAGFPNPARVVQIALPDPGPLLAPDSAKASSIGSVKATLKVTFNPEGKPSTAHFEYVDKVSFETENGFESPNTQTTPESAPTPAGFENQTASATNVCNVPTEASCLKPETTYYFRAFATNADGTVTGEKAEFTTKPPLEINAVWATDVGTDTARLHAEVNPLGIHTTGSFQYIAEGPDYQANGFQNAISTPASGQSLDFGAGEAFVTAAAQPYPLEPATTYHYRLLASDPYFPPAISAQGSFTTFDLPAAPQADCPNQALRTGPSAALPDCRAYEMVTPLDKSNGDVLTRINVTGYPTNLHQSSELGSDFTYSSYRAFAEPQAGPYTNQHMARRDPAAGWVSEAITPPRGPLFRNGELENPYRAFSSDLSIGWLMQEGDPPLASCAPAGFVGLYRRESVSGAFAALSCAQPNLASNVFRPELEGFSTDGSVAVFRVDDELAVNGSPQASDSGNYQVYISRGGQLRLLSVLPSGEASAADSSVGTAGKSEPANQNRFQVVERAVSEDGSRVYWSTGLSGSGPLYLRLNATQPQSNIDSVTGECTQPTRACTIAVAGSESAFFQTATGDGSKALYKVTSGPNSGNLYQFELGSAAPPQLIGEGVVGSILGASEDLARVYFVSTKASAQAQSEGALEGNPNIYLSEGGQSQFVGRFASSDLAGTSLLYGSPVGAVPIERTVRVSANGRSLVFMSYSRELSELTASHDNTDAVSGEPDAQVYLYDAEADGGLGSLHCVSCNPNGARPHGSEIEQGINNGVGPWAAAVLPRFETQFYQPRYLNDEGDRVFFNSFDALVLRDTNGAKDVYQWQAAGSGNCDAQSSAYVSISDGCLSLISSGQSPTDSELIDASASGNDVFFTTVEGLLPQDFGLIDVYDARVEGGFPSPSSAPAACEGEACQGPLQAPNDPTPASSTFEGAGNVKGETKAKGRCAKGKARRKGRCVANKPRKRAQRRSQRRANHDRKAER